MGNNLEKIDQRHWQFMRLLGARLQLREVLRPKKEPDEKPLHQQTMEKEFEEIQNEKREAKTIKKIIPFPEITKKKHEKRILDELFDERKTENQPIGDNGNGGPFSERELYAKTRENLWQTFYFVLEQAQQKAQSS